MEKTNLNDYSLASFLLEALYKRYYEGSILYRMADFELTKDKSTYELKVNGYAGVHEVNLLMNYSCNFGEIKGTVKNNINTEHEKEKSFGLYIIGSNDVSTIWVMYVDNNLYNLIDVPNTSSLNRGVPYGTKIYDAESQIKLRSQCQMILLPREVEKNDISYKTQDGKKTFTLSLDKNTEDEEK